MKFEEIITEFNNAESIAIFMHINPDADCIGSGLALYTFLRKMGKKAYVFTPDCKSTDMISKKIFCLPEINKLNKCDVSHFDLAVALDLGDPGRMGDIAFRVFLASDRRMVIDHHATYVDFTDISYRDASSCSTAQILFEIFDTYDKSLIDKNIATLLYAGIVTDSGNFTFECTSSKTFTVASSLLQFDIDITTLTRNLMKDESMEIYLLKNKVLSNARFFENNKIGLIVFRQNDFFETKTSEKDTEGIINCVENVDSVLIAISVSEITEGQYKVSFRSKGEYSAKLCAEKFGGGGHQNASGCRIYGQLDNAIKLLVDTALMEIKK